MIKCENKIEVLIIFCNFQSKLTNQGICVRARQVRLDFFPAMVVLQSILHFDTQSGVEVPPPCLPGCLLQRDAFKK